MSQAPGLGFTWRPMGLSNYNDWVYSPTYNGVTPIGPFREIKVGLYAQL